MIDLESVYLDLTKTQWNLEQKEWGAQNPSCSESYSHCLSRQGIIRKLNSFVLFQIVKLSLRLC